MNTHTLESGYTQDDSDDVPRPGGTTRADHVLVVAWCPTEPGRLGEILPLPRLDAEYVFGRGGAASEDTGGGAPGARPGESTERVVLRRERPGALDEAWPIRNPFVSRTQHKLRATPDGIRVENIGKRAISIDDVETAAGTVRPGGTLQIKGQLLFYCARRPRPMGPLQTPVPMHAFGEADAVGIVGEGLAAWSLRERVAFAAPRAPHVLLLGESGTGKELVAQALHQLSARGRRKMVARNAATFPAGLIDAELFGNVANYPSQGMPERPGVVGEADGSTLFLDEIGELPSELQSHLLRFLDERGEYQKLGDARRRTADVRVIAATNRALEELKHDVAARLQLRIRVPSLNDRVEDVPLLARHLLRKIAARDPAIGERFFAHWDGKSGEPRVTARLIRALLSHRYATNVRELESLLWCALSTSTTTELDVTDELRAMLSDAAAAADGPAAQRREATAEEIRAAMERHQGVQERVWRELGMPNRYVLQRLLKKYGMKGGGDE